MRPPRPFSALPPVNSYEASPKAISRRTSYLRVRLEFLRYPQVIPAFFNRRLVRSSMKFYFHFNLPMDRSPGFGSTSCNSGPIQTRFRFGSGPSVLNLAASRNSPVRSTKSTRSHALRALSACKHRVSGSLSLPSRGSFHLSLTVLCAIGHWIVFSLGGWSPLLPTRFLVSRGTLVPARCLCLSDTGLLPSLEVLSRTLLLDINMLSAGPQPHPTVVRWFGLLRVRSPLLTESMFLSPPPGT